MTEGSPPEMGRAPPPPPTGEDVSAAAALLVPFLVALVVLELAAPLTPRQLPHADPIVALFRAGLGRYGLLVFCALVLATWLWRRRPSREALRRAASLAAAGAGAALAVALLVRLAAGPTLPAFIPPEESARPGFAQGLSAGLVEEVLFRLLVLPAVFFSLRRRWQRQPAAASAIALTALAFALCHELGPGAQPFQSQLFLTRALLPGAGMSLLFFLSPAFVVVAHCTAHLLIPLLFA